MTQRQRREDLRRRERGREEGREVGRDGCRKRGREGGSNNLMFKFYLVYILMDVALLEK